MLEESIQYGRDRKAFGKPIIKREYWQHKFVDLYTKLEAARAQRLDGAEGLCRDDDVGARTHPEDAPREVAR